MGGGWELCTQSVIVKRFRDNRYRGGRLVTLPYLTLPYLTLPYLTLNYLIYTSNEYIIITLDNTTSVPLSVAHIHQIIHISNEKRRLPEDPLEGRTSLGIFFIRTLITFATYALPWGVAHTQKSFIFPTKSEVTRGSFGSLRVLDHFYD